MINKLKSEKGIAWMDIEISFIVIMIFVVLIGRMLYNISFLSLVTKKQNLATAYQTQILEDIDAMAFKNVTGNLTEYTDKNGNIIKIKDKYGFEDKGFWTKIWIRNEKYAKVVNVTMYYIVYGHTYSTSITRLKHYE